MGGVEGKEVAPDFLEGRVRRREGEVATEMADAVGKKFGVEGERGKGGVVQGDGAAVEEMGGGGEGGCKGFIGRLKADG